MAAKFIRSFKENKTYYILMFLICAAIFAVIYAINCLTGLHDDDYHFHFVFYDFNPTTYDKRVEGLADIFTSIKNYYFISGGRVVSHFLTYLMIFIGKPFFNVINSIIFIMQGLLLTFIVRGKAVRKSLATPALLILVYAMLWFSLPVPGETVFWISGSINYLWTACTCLAFLLRYINYYRGESLLKNNALCAVAMFIFGVFAGLTNENTGGTVLFILFVYFIMCIKGKLKIPAWAYTGVVGLIGGTAFLLTAPGNSNRAQNVEMGSLVSGDIRKLLYILSYIMRNASLAILLTMVLLAIIIFIRKNDADRKVLNLTFLYLAGGLLSIFVLILTPEFQNRPMFFGTVLVVLSFAKAADGVGDCLINIKKSSLGKLLSGAAAGFACIIFAISLGSVCKEYKVMDEFNRYEKSVYTEAQKNDEKEVTMDRFVYSQRTRYNINACIYNIGKDQDAYLNQWLAKYYGFEKVYTGDVIHSLDELK